MGKTEGSRIFAKNTGNGARSILPGTLALRQRDDTDDNAIIWYKLGFAEPGLTRLARLSITIIMMAAAARHLPRHRYNSPTSVDIEILTPF
jgi:hypothetical protein